MRGEFLYIYCNVKMKIAHKKEDKANYNYIYTDSSKAERKHLCIWP